MQMKNLIFILTLLVPIPAFATFGAATAWDVKTTGANTNGGGFDSGVGAPGTDESQGSGTAITCTLTGTTTATCSPAISATTHGPGNFINIASGSGCTTGWYEILSQSSGTATFDHAMGTATDACVGVVGGSLSTIQQANTNSVASNAIWCSGTYTFTTTLAVAQSTVSFIGYGSTHGDGTLCSWTTATNSTVIINTGSSNGGTQTFQNLNLSNTATTKASGIYQLNAHGTTQGWNFVNDTFNGFAVAIDSSDGTPDDVAFITVVNSLIENSTIAGISMGGTDFGVLRIFGSSFISNAQHISISDNSPVTIARTIFAGSTAAFGLNMDSIDSTTFDNCTFANNVNSSATVGFTSNNAFFALTNNIFYGNTGLGLAVITSTGNGAIRGLASSHSNAFGNNTGGTGWPGSVGDVALTANPFTNAGSGDYSLNSTAGGGAALKGAGFPGIFPGGTSTGHVDIGAVQSAGSSTTGNNFGVSQ
jgi:hypothetical protein